MRLNVVAISEIANIFANSKNASYMNGTTHFLLWISLENTK